MKIVFVAYNYLAEYNLPEAWIERIKPFAGVMESLGHNCKVIYAGLINYTGTFLQNGVEYHFLPSKKRKPRFPIQFHREIKKLQPDVVVVMGLQYPLQIMQLRRSLNKKIKIVARHHADTPPIGIKRKLQQMSDNCIDAYLFTTDWHAGQWIEAGIIRNKNKIHEVFEASTDFSRQNKNLSKEKTGMTGENNFLWVGRLNQNKDPITVLTGFEKYLAIYPEAHLYMIFQEDDLLETITKKIKESSTLRDAVFLQGAVAYNKLEEWYSAADFFISGSHREGGSFALLEAMACGCIPIVTAIPASLKSIDNGKYGFSFEPGNSDDLAQKFLTASKISKKDFSLEVEKYFKEKLSSKAIADRLFEILKELQSK
ncbi:MAG TPA: glycosyltransferase family 4 protein [Chitinophagaceae bacterium]|jgi:glycosyltransferase involved in cell wall biosynthesis|nr:glycosyltransferase family 4 protein [Chitinophagaceae bacterium]